MKTQNEVRKAFWDQHPQYKSEYRRTKKQNDYNADIRTAFVDWVDFQQKDGNISEKLAYRVTLGPYYIKVNKIADFEFWVNCFKPRTKKWRAQTLKRLKASKSPFETESERADKIKALEFLK